jgi:DNA repair exonuclease SbcCD ATPase subunit
MESEAQTLNKTIEEQKKSIDQLRQQSQKDNLELQNTKARLQKEQEDPKKEQIKRQKEQIEQLEKELKDLRSRRKRDSTEIFRLQSIETDRNNLKTNHDKLMTELNTFRSRRKQDSTEIVRLQSIETDRNNLKTSHDRLMTELNNVRSLLKQDSAEIVRLKSIETDRNNLKANHDRVITELNNVRLLLKQDSVEIVRLKSVEIDRNNLKTSHDRLMSELNTVHLLRKQDSAEIRRINEEYRNKQSDLNKRLASLETEKRNAAVSYDSITRILSDIRFKLAIEDAKELLNRAYNEYSRSDINNHVTELGKIPASSPHYAAATTTIELLKNYGGKWARFDGIIKTIKATEGNKTTSMTMQAQHLKDIFSWIKSDSYNAFKDFQNYPFLLKKLQDLTVLKIENVNNNVDDIFK